jgi:hypothetical protein
MQALTNARNSFHTRTTTCRATPKVRPAIRSRSPLGTEHACRPTRRMKQRTLIVLLPTQPPHNLHLRSGAFRLLSSQDDKAAKLKALDGDLGFLVEQDVAAAQGASDTSTAEEFSWMGSRGQAPGRQSHPLCM